MSVLSSGCTTLPYYAVGDMTFVPGHGDDLLLEQESIEIAEQIWPSHKVYYLAPEDLNPEPNNVLVLHQDLDHHAVDLREMVIWDRETNIIPAAHLKEGVIVSVTGDRFRALLRISWRHAVCGAVDFFINRWESVGESNTVYSCFLTPYVAAEHAELLHEEARLLHDSLLSEYIRPIGCEDEEKYGLDLSLAVKHQLESWLGCNEVIIIRSVANHLGDSGRTAEPPTPGVYLGLCE